MKLGKFSLTNHTKAIQGIDASLYKRVLDENPAAYKDISSVMEAQSDLVEIVHCLRPIFNVRRILEAINHVFIAVSI